ncbi:MAG: hypothetical protein NBV60_05685 [Erythrobacter sp.]|nr:hypothetical protein [Erythrobacter sp.]
MANLSRPQPARQILAREPAPRVIVSRRKLIAGAAIALALAGLAWIDGGEEPLHPIAQEVAVPGAAQ